MKKPIALKLMLVILLGITILAPMPVFILPVQAQAQSEQQSLQIEGLAINPFLIEVDAGPGQTVTKQINLANTTDRPLSFVASINDFVPNGTTGQPMFLGTNEDADAKYSLGSWISITKQPQFTIPPNGETTVEFAITIPNDAEPGTHYGGILFGRPAMDLQNTGSAVQHKAGAIVIVKLGQSQEQIAIDEFISNKRVYNDASINFKTILHNPGNVHSKPKGEITIKNIFGKQVAQIPVNRDASIVLPATSREFFSEWQPRWAIGRYSADEIIYYGSPKLELHAKTVFWVLPLKLLVNTFFLVVILAIILYRGLRAYNKYIINRSRNEI